MKVTTLATVCDGETIRKGEPQPKASGAAEHMSSEGGNDGLGSTTLYGHAPGGRRGNREVAYYSTEDECIKARTIFGKDGKSQTPRIPLALCVPVESPQHIITK